jgi:glutamine amidotransferase
MCRLLGAVSAEIVDHHHALRAAPTSLAALSPDHPHGWGLALSDGRRGWDLHKSPTCALDDPRFGDLARTRARVLVAHVRKKTVGPASLGNTHPFQRGRWIFAHNGTLHDTGPLERRTSGPRRAELEGDTDSERLFAFLLSAIDRAGGAAGVRRAAPGAVDRALRAAIDEVTASVGFGAANFLCSDGEALYAHRHGRSLHVLERRGMVLLASETIGEGPWQEMGDGDLLRVDVGREPRVRWLTEGVTARLRRSA